MFNFLRHLFLPHHTNDHRPKILHHSSLSFFIVFFLAVAIFLPPLQRSYPSVLGASVNISIEELVRLTNQKRAEAGLAPLTLNNELSNAATSKATYMFEKNFWAHVAPDGTTPWYFIKNSGYEYQYAGENLARGFNSAEEVVNAWMASPTHRENLLSSNYKDIGFAVASGSLTGSDTVLVVQEFGNRFEPEEAIAGSQVPVVTPVLSQAPTQQIGQMSSNSPRSSTTVAAATNKPLIDSRSTAFNISVYLLGLIIIILIVDAVIIKRRKISRIVAHNLDHIIFLIILLLAAIIIARGVVL